MVIYECKLKYYWFYSAGILLWIKTLNSILYYNFYDYVNILSLHTDNYIKKRDHVVFINNNNNDYPEPLVETKSHSTLLV
jgi:hypothetical protein